MTSLARAQKIKGVAKETAAFFTSSMAAKKVNTEQDFVIGCHMVMAWAVAGMRTGFTEEEIIERVRKAVKVGEEVAPNYNMEMKT